MSEIDFVRSRLLNIVSPLIPNLAQYNVNRITTDFVVQDVYDCDGFHYDEDGEHVDADCSDWDCDSYPTLILRVSVPKRRQAITSSHYIGAPFVMSVFQIPLSETDALSRLLCTLLPEIPTSHLEEVFQGV